MYYSQLKLNLHSPRVRKDLANTYDMHKRIYSAFGYPLSSSERILYRVEDYYFEKPPSVIVQSLTKPDWSVLDVSTSIREPYVLDIKTKQAEVEFMNGESYKFRLVVDVTENKEGHSYRLIIDEKEQLDWLKKRCGYRGFKLQQVLILGRRQIEITQRNGNAFYLNAVHFEGILSVEDKDKFTIGYRSGIGHGKGFGMGMLSLIRY